MVRSRPIDLPALRYPHQGVAALVGRVLRMVSAAVLVAVLAAFRMLTVLLLQVLRPFIVWPLMLACVGGMAATVGFAASRSWVDAARAGSATLTSALVLGLYSRLAQTIDPEHFDRVPGRERGPWTAGGRCHDDAE